MNSPKPMKRHCNGLQKTWIQGLISCCLQVNNQACRPHFTGSKHVHARMVKLHKEILHPVTWSTLVKLTTLQQRKRTWCYIPQFLIDYRPTAKPLTCSKPKTTKNTDCVCAPEFVFHYIKAVKFTPRTCFSRYKDEKRKADKVTPQNPGWRYTAKDSASFVRYIQRIKRSSSVCPTNK